MSENPYRCAEGAAEMIQARLGEHETMLVLGSGWVQAVPRLGEVVEDLPIEELPGFAAPRVRGHGGLAQSFVVEGRRVLVLGGRSHLYEGHPVDVVVHGVRAGILSGCRRVVLTNAAGSLNPAFAPGTAVALSDHLNLTGANPMAGAPPPEGYAERFVDLSAVYDSDLRRAAAEGYPELREGVYAGLLGGSYETPAEVRMLGTFGADLVGMSTVLEAIAARHLGARVFGASLVTNPAAGMGDAPLDHGDVLAEGVAAGERLAGLLRAVILAS